MKMPEVTPHPIIPSPLPSPQGRGKRGRDDRVRGIFRRVFMGIPPTRGNENHPRPRGRRGTPWRAPTAFALGDFQERGSADLPFRSAALGPATVSIRSEKPQTEKAGLPTCSSIENRQFRCNHPRRAGDAKDRGARKCPRRAADLEKPRSALLFRSNSLGWFSASRVR